MLAILNEPGLDIARLRMVLDCTGDKSYPGMTPPSPRYTDPLSTATNDGLGRMTVLINEVVTPAGAANLITILNDIADMNKLTGLLAKINVDGTAKSGGGMDRVRYLSDTINNVANISLLMNILNGPSGFSAADYDALVGLMNEVGGSTQKGGGIKPIGDLSIVWGVINLLGWNYVSGQPRTPAEQARVITLVNTVNRCGIQSGYELNSPWNHLLTEPCSSGKKRLSEFMLGMDNPDPVAIIVGNVTDTTKTVKILNGYQTITKLIQLINLLPGEVTAAFLNNLDNTNNVVYGSALYVMNKLSYDSMAGMMHFGTGIGEGSSRSGTLRLLHRLGSRAHGAAPQRRDGTAALQHAHQLRLAHGDTRHGLRLRREKQPDHGKPQRRVHSDLPRHREHPDQRAPLRERAVGDQPLYPLLPDLPQQYLQLPQLLHRGSRAYLPIVVGAGGR